MVTDLSGMTCEIEKVGFGLAPVGAGTVGTLP
jgi:hypothetical protein